MTAEIAILNKSAVALAADSAVSLGTSGKIFPGNKLFALTKWHPVGVMVYNNAEYMGIPWETVIKMYRLELGKNAKPSIQDYVDDFLRYLTSDCFCTEERVKNNFLEIARDEFENIWWTVKKFKNSSNSGGNPSYAQDSVQLLNRAVERRLLELSGEAEKLESIGEAEIEQLVLMYRSQIFELVEQIFQGMDITELTKSELLRVLQVSVKSNHVSGRHTGIVIAGFGAEEIFPSLFEIVLDGVIDKSLKFNIQQRCQIGKDSDATVIPFAQGEMIKRFMEGIDSEFLEYLYFTTESILEIFGENILNEINLDNDQYYESVEESSRVMMQVFHNRLQDIRQTIFMEPITQIIRHLPKDELSGMAETLVSLTSLKRRVSFEPETVGGPVDVAIISKGDGLIWRKRKHYFDTTLNPDYFNRQEI